VQPDETGAAALPAGWHQHVDEIHSRFAPDAVVQQSDRVGDDAARSGVQHGRQFLLGHARDPGRRQVDAGQQRLPRATAADAILHRAIAHAEGEQLSAADHGGLLLQELA
jgi:hypothetical protein